MLPPEQQPFKVAKVGNRLTMQEAYRQDLDFWGNQERGLYRSVTQSLARFLIDTVSNVRSNTFTFWCDIGCGPGYFLEGMKESLTNASGPTLIASGVDVSPQALARCRSVFDPQLTGDGDFQDERFVEMDLDNFTYLECMHAVPWLLTDVVSFIDTLQYFKDYRRTFGEILKGLRVGTVIVVADGMGRSNLREYPGQLDNVAQIGGWIDYSMPVTPRNPADPKSKNRHLVYRVYMKMA